MMQTTRLLPILVFFSTLVHACFTRVLQSVIACLFSFVRLTSSNYVRFIAGIVICFSFLETSATSIKGRITDERKEPLPFANIVIKGTSIGTTSNEQGYYELKLAEGTYTITCQYIGYKPQTATVKVQETQSVETNFQLVPEDYQLKEVNINATAENPAYPIMRQAIARRKIYQFEAKEYACRVYLKGLQRLTTVPKKVMMIKIPVDIKPGIVYLSESLSDLQVQTPDKVKEKLLSSKVSGDNRAFSFNRAGSIKFSLYEPLINSFRLSERGFVSPLANNAMSMYTYKLVGEVKENNQTIYKIQIAPKRRQDPAFSGYIYIVKDSWRLHSTDLILNKDAGLEFVDTLYVKQQYAPQGNGVWMPVSQRFIFQFEAFGFKGNGYFVAAYSNYKVNSNYPPSFYTNETQAIVKDEPTPQVRKVPAVKLRKKDLKNDSSLFAKKHFTNEVMLIDKQANKTPDSIWETLRPVPLTDEELLDYRVKDSVQQIESSKPYLDSVDRIENKPDWVSVLLTGYTYANSYRKRYLSFEPPPTIVQYNTVEGLVLNPRISFTKLYENNTEKEWITQLRYGFASKSWYGKMGYYHYYDPIKESRWGIEAGNMVAQFNGQEPITPFINTVYTLLDARNYLKLYEKSFAKVQFRSEVVNGLRLQTSLEWAHRSNLFNHADFAFRGNSNKHFTPNQPVNLELGSSTFTPHQALLLDAALQITFAQKYISRPDMKIDFRSKYPVFTIGYRKGIKVSIVAPDFDEVNLSARYSQSFGLWGMANFRAGGGLFLNRSRVYLMDLHHFGGNQTILSLRGFNGYQLLDYYAYSTSKGYVQGFYNHHFNGFILNKIPLLRKLKWQEVISLNYLNTQQLQQYMELGAGIEHVFKIGRIDYYQAYSNGTYLGQGIRIGIGF